MLRLPWCRDARRHRRMAIRGATALEFALVFPAFLLMFAGTFELGRYFLTLHSVRTVAAEAARAAVADPTISSDGAQDCRTPVNLVGGVVPLLALSTSGQMLCVTRDPTRRILTVTAQYPFQFLLPKLIEVSAALTRITVSTTMPY